MPKKDITKDRTSITLDSELLKELKKQCQERTMKLSSYIEKLVRAGYENERRNKK